MLRRYQALICLAMLAGCSKADEEASARSAVVHVGTNANADAAPQNKFGFHEALDQGPDLFGANEVPARYTSVQVSQESSGGSDGRVTPPVPAGEHQIAYSYGFGFRVSKNQIAKLQAEHARICDAMQAKCRILRVSQASTDYDGFGEMTLQVAATEAGSMQKALVAPAERLGAELISSVRDGEDLAESIVDTEAKLQSRLVLRQKLTDILRSNRGGVAELIAAEKAIADVNEEVDAARTLLEQYRNRIRFSEVKIEYQPEFGQSQLGFSKPVMTAIRSAGSTLGTTIAVLIYALVALIPVVTLILAVRWLLHRFGLRIRFWRRAKPAADQQD